MKSFGIYSVLLLIGSENLLLAEMDRSNDPLFQQFEKIRERPKPAAVNCIEPSQATGSSLAVVVDEGSLVHTTQLLPLEKNGKVVGAADAVRQTQQVLTNLSHVLSGAHSDIALTIKLNVYLAQPEILLKVQDTLAAQFNGATKPAVSFVVTELPERDALVAMDAVAACLAPSSVYESAVLSNSAVSSHAGMMLAGVSAQGAKVYISGMADTNSLPEATRKTLEKLNGVVRHLGLNKSDIVQLKAFLQPMSKVESVRSELRKFFGEWVPPSSFVEWISPPPNPSIEIELVVAAKGDFSKEQDSVTFITPPGTTPSKVFSRIARVNHGKLIYFSGLYGMKSQDAAAQVREIFGGMGEVLKKTSSDFQHLVKATYYVSDEEASKKLNDIRPEFFHPERPPAASKAKVTNVGLPGKNVTLDMIAVTK